MGVGVAVVGAGLGLGLAGLIEPLPIFKMMSAAIASALPLVFSSTKIRLPSSSLSPPLSLSSLVLFTAPLTFFLFLSRGRLPVFTKSSSSKRLHLPCSCFAVRPASRLSISMSCAELVAVAVPGWEVFASAARLERLLH